ncbi:8224_t:CDS:2, partial [Racocetra fulgida]
MSLSQNKYSDNNPFSVKQNNTTYKYHIINEGFYPPKDKLCYTSVRSHNGGQYKIPDNYLVQTSWGRNKSKHIIECKIKYELNGPIFRIRFQEDSQQYIIESKESPSAAANNYLWVQRERKNWSSSFRPFNTLSESMKTKCSRAFSIQLGEAFKNEIPNFFNSIDQPVLQEVRFHVQDKDYLANYHNKEKTNSFDTFVKVIDQDQISRNAYQKLAVLQPELPRDHNISGIRKKINEKMDEKVPINIVNVKNVPLVTTNEVPHINDQEIEEEMFKYIGKAGYRRITNILLFIIPDLVKQNILNINNPDDGKSTDRKSAIFEILSYENRLLHFIQNLNSNQ